MKLISKWPLPWWWCGGILFMCYQLPSCVSVVATVTNFFLVSCDIGLILLGNYAMPHGGRSSCGVSSRKNPYPRRGREGTASHGRTVSSPSTSVTSTPITATTPLVTTTTPPITTATITLPTTSVGLEPGRQLTDLSLDEFLGLVRGLCVRSRVGHCLLLRAQHCLVQLPWVWSTRHPCVPP